jgi:serine protease Do
MSFKKGFALGLVMLLVITAAVMAFRLAFFQRKPETSSNPTPTHYSTRRLSDSDFESLAARVESAVVNVNTEFDVPTHFLFPFGDSFPGHGVFDSLDALGSFRRSSLGSGFLVHSDGYILTNSHVVEDASRISVKLSDNRILEAVVVGTDPKTDLAVLKIKGSNFPVLRLAQSDDVAVGEWVAAFGSPFGLEQTITAGIISAKGRVLGSEFYDHFLQTDAAINAGNSGGPLVNLRGEVVGVNTAIANQSAGFSGIGFAIPAETARSVCDRLIRSGRITRGWLGIRIQGVTPEIARSFGLEYPWGALVSEAVSGGPGAEAGLRSGDLILEYNHRKIQTPQDLSAAVADTQVGTKAHLRILRDGKEQSIDVSVGERPSAVARHFRSPEKSEPGRLGLTVENVTPEIRAQVNLASGSGVLVLDVSPGSAADSGGVRPGDVILGMNHSTVNTVADLLAITRDLKENSIVLLRLERRGKMFYLAFELS